MPTINKPPFNWRAVLPIHPAAELFPLMSEAELRELAGDIKANGLIDPVVFWVDDNGDKFLIDGRNRLDAMAIAGILAFDDHGILFNVKTGEPVYLVSFPDQKPCAIGGDPYAIALSLNVHRRHLNAEQKRQLIARVLKLDPEKSNRQIAEQVKDDHKKVGDVRSKLEATGAIPQLKKTKGKDGKARPAKAKKKSTIPPIPPVPIKAAPVAAPEAKPAIPAISAKATESILNRINDLARDGRGLSAHPEQNVDEIRGKFSQIIKLCDPDSKGRSKKSAASNAKLDQNLFRHAMALETEVFADAIRQLKGLLTKPGEMFADAAPVEDLKQIADFLNHIASIKKSRNTGNDVDVEASAEARRAVYKAVNEAV